MTSRDIAVGSYFAMWEAKRQRLLHPMFELLEHAQGAQGVIASDAPQELVDELMWYFPLVAASYRKSPAQVQWMLDQFPTRRKPAGSTTNAATTVAEANADAMMAGVQPEVDDDVDPFAPPSQRLVPQPGSKIRTRGFRLISARCESEKFKPAFILAVNEELRMAVFAVRGTSDMNDLVTDGLCDVAMAPFGFHETASAKDPTAPWDPSSPLDEGAGAGAGAQQPLYHVHAGMLEAARWLVKGDDRHAELKYDDEVSDAAKTKAAAATTTSTTTTTTTTTTTAVSYTHLTLPTN